MKEILMKRPAGYLYWERLKQHLGGDIGKIFDGNLVYPRQLEIHLPGDGKKMVCNFNCWWCQGSELVQPIGHWEKEGLELLHNLKGAIPLHVYGGAYSEPMLNDYMLEYLKTTKKYGNEFGIHTNGSQLIIREQREGFLTELIEIANGKNDYLSISLDAGFAETHTKTKGLDANWFDSIIAGLNAAAEIRGEKKYPALRIVYLLNKQNSSPEEIENIISIGKELKLDSIRFSIPYDLYGRDFNRVKKYKQRVEMKTELLYYNLLKSYIETQRSDSKPFIFWVPPKYQDVEEMNYRQCIYSYFQITLAADGWIYKCSSTASPSFKFCRLGKITSDLEKFNKMVVKNHNPNWDPTICFRHGARCNRMAIELNNMWRNNYV